MLKADLPFDHSLEKCTHVIKPPNLLILRPLSPYHHLHILPEASAVYSGTEGLTMMLSLCYG